MQCISVASRTLYLHKASACYMKSPITSRSNSVSSPFLLNNKIKIDWLCRSSIERLSFDAPNAVGIPGDAVKRVVPSFALGSVSRPNTGCGGIHSEPLWLPVGRYTVLCRWIVYSMQQYHKVAALLHPNTIHGYSGDLYPPCSGWAIS